MNPFDASWIVPDLPCLICGKVNHGVAFCDDACRKAWQLRYDLGMIDFEAPPYNPDLGDGMGPLTELQGS